MPKVIIEIEEPLYNQVEAAIKDMMLPPVREGDRFVQEKAYPKGFPDWLADVLANNIANIVRHQPTPEMQAIQVQVAELEQRHKRLMRPKVSVERT